MKGADRRRRREACPQPGQEHSLLTTTAALVDTCPYPFVATAEYVAVSSKFALGERESKAASSMHCGTALEARDPDRMGCSLKASCRT